MPACPSGGLWLCLAAPVPWRGGAAAGGLGLQVQEGCVDRRVGGRERVRCWGTPMCGVCQPEWPSCSSGASGTRRSWTAKAEACGTCRTPLPFPRRPQPLPRSLPQWWRMGRPAGPQADTRGSLDPLGPAVPPEDSYFGMISD